MKPIASVNRLYLTSLFLILVSCGLGVGCSDSIGFSVAGKVTFRGQPVPDGKIYFTPDATKGNTGAPGFADIKDGAYNTRASGGVGITGGPMLVRIEGMDGKSRGADLPYGEQLFLPYETTLDLPKGASTKDFEVPGTVSSAK